MNDCVLITVPTIDAMVQAAAGITADGHPPEESGRDVSELLKLRQFKHGIAPPPLRPIYTLAGHVIATPGNLVAITSGIKTGKSVVVGAMAASVMVNSVDADLLGFRSSNPKNHALLHFDSEQSPDDHWTQVHRALQRAGRSTPPPWFHSYCLTGLGCRQTLDCVTEATRIAAEEHGGIHSILIDGVADLVLNVNDPAECNAFVADLHGRAMQYDCPIAGVIHFNPGGEKVRGHLGSQLERKAETNLRLDKIDGVTVIWSDKQRRAPIPKETGPCFKWSDEAGMHVSIHTQQASKVEIETERLTALMEDVFANRPSMRYSDLISTLKTTLRVSDATAERKAGKALKLGVIKKAVAGLYALTT